MKYLLNENFVALRKGEHVKANSQAGEFIFDTKDNNFKIGQLQEIAMSNNLDEVNSNEELEVSLESLDVPSQFEKTVTEKINDIVREGFEEGKSDDDICVDIVMNKLCIFSKARRELKRAQVELGLIKEAKEVKEESNKLDNVLDEVNLEFETADDMIDTAKSIADENSLETSKVLARMKKKAKGLGIVLPKIQRLKTSTPKKDGWAYYYTEIFNFIIDNPNATLQDIFEIPKVAKDLSKGSNKVERLTKRYSVYLEFANRIRASV